jgi:hypothetical protein
MSDVTVAPPGSAPSAAPVNEVVINETPVNPPTPIGSQAPEKPAAEARKESIKAAFDRANNPQKTKPAEKPAPKAAEAKPGHNQPPEETEKLDLKKRPSDPPRAEGGRFAPHAQGAQNTAQAQANGAQTQARNALPENTPYREPPPRFSEGGKSDWANTSENVRGDVYRMHQEFNKAYQQYRGAHEAFQPIAHFHQMAQEHGTTLDRALHNYVSMEHKLRQDLVGGLDIIVNNLNLRTADGQKLGLRDVAYHILNQSPEQHKLVQNQNAQSAASQQIGALHQEVAGLKNALHQMHNAQQFTYTRSAVDQFAESHPRFDELGDLIENELKFGFDLETAYRRAELLRPATHAAQTRTASAQTRPIDRSISGAPAGPSNGTGRDQKKPVGRREAISNAMKRVSGAL